MWPELPASRPATQPDPPLTDCGNDNEVDDCADVMPPCTDEMHDDELWEVFVLDPDEFDPDPGRGDFWFEKDLSAGIGDPFES